MRKPTEIRLACDYAIAEVNMKWPELLQDPIVS